MKLVEKILVATDLSETSSNVIENAIDMAKQFQSEIVLIYVLPEDTGSPKANELLHDFAKKELQSVYDKLKAEDVKLLAPILEKGDFSDKIVETAESIDASIIFAGSGEKEKDGRPILGSNAEKIIKKTSKPVFVAKTNTPLHVSTILCPVDFSPESKRALKNAISFANNFGAKIVVLSVYDVSNVYPIKNMIKMQEHLEYIREVCQSDLKAFLKDVDFGEVEVTTLIEKGDPANQILKAVDKNNVDLLMMGTTGKTGITKMLIGSVTKKVIHELPCSFITMKK